MKRDFLKNLGIEDKDIIDKILDENSADIGRAKGELDTHKSRVTELEGQIKEKDGKIATLQADADKVAGLNQQIIDLTNEKTRLTTELDTKVTQLQREHAIEGGIRDANPKNIKAVMALLDMEKITYADGKLGGLSEQIDALKSAEDTSFLFNSGNHAPTGTSPTTPPTKGGTPPTAGSFRDAVAKALTKSN